jgi:hypothetical protein
MRLWIGSDEVDKRYFGGGRENKVAFFVGADELRLLKSSFYAF